MLVLRLLLMVLTIICLMDGHAEVSSSTTGMRNGGDIPAVKPNEMEDQILDRKKKPKKPKKPKKTGKKKGKKPKPKPKPTKPATTTPLITPSTLKTTTILTTITTTETTTPKSTPETTTSTATITTTTATVTTTEASTPTASRITTTPTKTTTTTATTSSPPTTAATTADSGAGGECKATNGKPCIFPYKDGNEEYNECKNEGGKYFWCATSVYDSGKYKHWSYCPEDRSCPLEGDGECRAENNKPCVFPFKDGGKEYNECADHGGQYFWCATGTNSAGMYTAWSKCPKDGSCPLLQKSTTPVMTPTAAAVTTTLLTTGTTPTTDKMEDKVLDTLENLVLGESRDDSLQMAHMLYEKLDTIIKTLEGGTRKTNQSNSEDISPESGKLNITIKRDQDDKVRDGTELGKGLMFILSTVDSMKSVSRMSGDCCKDCRSKYPDTELAEYWDSLDTCYCYKKIKKSDGSKVEPNTWPSNEFTTKTCDIKSCKVAKTRIRDGVCPTNGFKKEPQSIKNIQLYIISEPTIDESKSDDIHTCANHCKKNKLCDGFSYDLCETHGVILCKLLSKQTILLYYNAKIFNLNGAKDFCERDDTDLCDGKRGCTCNIEGCQNGHICSMLGDSSCVSLEEYLDPDTSAEAQVPFGDLMSQAAAAPGFSIFGGPSLNEGNVFFNGAPICDDMWDDTDSGVFCRSLGYETGIATSQSTYGPVFPNFSMDNVQCTGNENSLLGCPHVSQHDCGSSEAAGAICLGNIGGDGTPPAVKPLDFEIMEQNELCDGDTYKRINNQELCIQALITINNNIKNEEEKLKKGRILEERLWKSGFYGCHISHDRHVYFNPGNPDPKADDDDIFKHFREICLEVDEVDDTEQAQSSGDCHEGPINENIQKCNCNGATCYGGDTCVRNPKGGICLCNTEEKKCTNNCYCPKYPIDPTVTPKQCNRGNTCSTSGQCSESYYRCYSYNDNNKDWIHQYMWHKTFRIPVFSVARVKVKPDTVYFRPGSFKSDDKIMLEDGKTNTPSTRISKLHRRNFLDCGQLTNAPEDEWKIDPLVPVTNEYTTKYFRNFDRGHLLAANFIKTFFPGKFEEITFAAQFMSNIWPQNSQCNRGLYKNIEKVIADEATNCIKGQSADMLNPNYFYVAHGLVPDNAGFHTSTGHTLLKQKKRIQRVSYVFIHYWCHVAMDNSAGSADSILVDNINDCKTQLPLEECKKKADPIWCTYEYLLRNRWHGMDLGTNLDTSEVFDPFVRNGRYIIGFQNTYKFPDDITNNIRNG